MRIHTDIYNIAGIKEISIPIYAELADFYVANQKKLLLESIVNKGYAISKVMQLKHNSIKSFQKDIKLMNTINSLSQNCHFTNSSIDISQFGFQKYKNKIIPTPVVPTFFNDIITSSPITDILSIIDNTNVFNAAKEILNNSDLNSNIYGFRTIQKKEESIIQGKLDNTFSSITNP